MALQATPSESSQQVAAGPASSSRAPFPASRSTTMMSLRAANLSMEADQALYLEPAALRTVGWMGANGATALTHDTGAYHADPVKREEARSERVKLARQARAFVEDVEATLDEAGVPMPRGAPGVSPRSSTAPGVGAFSPAFLRLSNCNSSSLASPSATSRGSRGSRGTASSAQSPQQKQKAIQQRDDVAVSRAVSTLARSVDEEAIASGQMLVSAFDGSAHCSAARLFEHNVFVHQRMIAIVDEEENMEAEGHIFSAGQSMMSENGCGTPHAHPNGSAASQAKVRGRRPDSIPKPADWESIPPSIDANGNEIDRSIVEAANRGYNDSARNSARRLMAHRCFRKHDFVAEHENSVAATTAAALDSCIADGRAATAHSIAVDNQVGGAVDPDTISDAVARSTEVLALAERWTKEATTRGAQEGDAARYDPVASPTSAVPTPKAADAPRARSEDVEGAAARQAFAAFVNSAALLMAEPVVSAGPVDRWVRQGRIAALRDVALRVKSAAGPSPKQ